jgi:hypothetical protein
MKHRRILWESCLLMLCLWGGYILQGGQVSLQLRKAEPARFQPESLRCPVPNCL